MSSSQLRAFRHTATVIALEVETSLCEVAAEVEKEAEVVSRQREGERKRKKGKADASTARDKDLEKKAEEVRERRKKLSEYLKEFVDGYGIFKRIALTKLLTSITVSSFIDTVTWTPTFERNVSVLWVSGSQSTPPIFWMAHTCDMSAGFYPIPTLMSVSKLSRLYLWHTHKPTTSVSPLCNISLNGSLLDWSKWL